MSWDFSSILIAAGQVDIVSKTLAVGFALHGVEFCVSRPRHRLAPEAYFWTRNGEEQFSILTYHRPSISLVRPH